MCANNKYKNLKLFNCEQKIIGIKLDRNTREKELLILNSDTWNHLTEYK